MKRRNNQASGAANAISLTKTIPQNSGLRALLSKARRNSDATASTFEDTVGTSTPRVSSNSRRATSTPCGNTRFKRARSVCNLVALSSVSGMCIKLSTFPSICATRLCSKPHMNPSMPSSNNVLLNCLVIFLMSSLGTSSLLNNSQTLSQTLPAKTLRS